MLRSTVNRYPKAFRTQRGGALHTYYLFTKQVQSLLLTASSRVLTGDFSRPCQSREDKHQHVQPHIFSKRKHLLQSLQPCAVSQGNWNYHHADTKYRRVQRGFDIYSVADTPSNFFHLPLGGRRTDTSGGCAVEFWNGGPSAVGWETTSGVIHSTAGAREPSCHLTLLSRFSPFLSLSLEHTTDGYCH